MLSVFLEHLLLGPSGLTSVGLPLLIAGVHRMVFGRLANLLSDGDGHRQALDWKGANGLKPCIKHVNVLKKDRVGTAMGTFLDCEWLGLRLLSFRCGSGSLLQGSDLVDKRKTYRHHHPTPGGSKFCFMVPQRATCKTKRTRDRLSMDIIQLKSSSALRNL